MQKFELTPIVDRDEERLEINILDSFIVIFWQLFNHWEEIPENLKIEITNLITSKFTDIFSQYYKYDRKIFKTVKINNLEEFWFGDSWQKSSTLSKALSLGVIKTSIAIGIQEITSPIATLIFGCNNTQVKVKQFSKEIANYVTSEDVISSLSKQIDKPKRRETKEQFVERASRVLVGILQEKLLSL
ncbi:hypothetical protein NUACC21_60980 [Scytonema sp. NUACC21]